MSNTIKLFENMQLNLKESNNEFEWLDQENMEKYMTADSILGRCDLYFGDTAEELGMSEEEAIQNQADIYKVEIVEKNLLGPEYGGSAGCWDITAKGAPKDIIQFFSNGEFNNGNDYISAFDLEVKLPEIDESSITEDTADNIEVFNKISEIQNTIQSKTGCTVTIEGSNTSKPVVYIKGNTMQLSNCLEYVDALIDLFKQWGNEALANYSKDGFTITIQ